MLHLPIIDNCCRITVISNIFIFNSSPKHLFILSFSLVCVRYMLTSSRKCLTTPVVYVIFQVSASRTAIMEAEEIAAQGQEANEQLEEGLFDMVPVIHFFVLVFKQGLLRQL